MSLTISTQNLILEKSTLFDEDSYIKEASDYNSLDYSFFNEALDYCKDIKSQLRSCSRDLYHTIHEAESIEVVHEGFSEFASKVKEIIKKFFEYLKSLFNRFITNLHGLVKSDKYLKKKKDLFSKFTSDNEFEIERYEYTHIQDSGYPSTTPLTDTAAEIKDILNIISQNKNGAKKAKVDNEKFYNKFRYQVIHPEKSTGGTIHSSDYNEKLFDAFRDGGTKKSITVTSSVVSTAYQRFAGYDDTIKSVKKNKKQLEDDYKEIKETIDDLISIENDVVSVSNTVMTGVKEKSTEYYNIEAVVKAYVDRIAGMSAIHLQAFGAKLDAITECYKEDKKLLYKALNKIQKVQKESIDNLDIEDDFIDEDIVAESVRNRLFDDMDRLVKSSNYTYFLISEVYEQDKMLEYINNEILAESDIKFGYITEGVGEKVKNTLDKIMKFLSKIWGKFKEFIAKVFESDKKYLERYKDIILRKPPKDADIEMCNYVKNGALKSLQNDVVPLFNYKQLNDNAKELKTYCKNTSPYMKYYKNSELTVSQNYVTYFTEKTETVKATTLNMTDLFNYIYNFKSDMEKKFTKELTNLEKEASEARKLVSAEVETTEGEGKDNAESQNSSAIFLDPHSQINKLLEDYFTEDISITSNDGSSSDTSSSSSSSSSGTAANTKTPDQTGAIGKNIQNRPGETSKEAEAREKENSTDINAAKADEKQKDADIEAKINSFFNAASGLITGKQNLALRIYKDYFKIIRWHVQQYNGDKDRHVADKATTQSTNYQDSNDNYKTGDSVVVGDTRYYKQDNGLWNTGGEDNSTYIYKNGEMTKQS